MYSFLSSSSLSLVWCKTLWYMHSDKTRQGNVPPVVQNVRSPPTARKFFPLYGWLLPACVYVT
jgi:hypothetical protein